MSSGAVPDHQPPAKQLHDMSQRILAEPGSLTDGTMKMVCSQQLIWVRLAQWCHMSDWYGTDLACHRIIEALEN